MFSFSHNQKGITAIEIVFGVSIAGIILVFGINAIVLFVNSARAVTEQTQALYLVEDGLELIRFARDNNWAQISVLPLNTTRYLNVTNASVVPTATPEIINGFTRSFKVNNVYRDPATDDIVASTSPGSVADSDSKYVTMTVTWGTSGKKVELETILTNIDP